MRMVRAAALACVLVCALVSPVAAREGHPARSGSNAHMVTRTFTVRVVGHVDRNATFWVAYGPLDGRFGMLQLHRVGDGHLYQAATALPARARSVFAFLQGRGTVQSRLGAGPGDPVVTIARVGPAPVARGDLPVVAWRGPIG